ncbi:MAG: SOS response-associated peptidase [Gammaproteobacteria bacterium]
MCGRFAIYSSAGVIVEEFSLTAAPDIKPRYNVAPGQELLVVLSGGAANVPAFYRWGLVPFWAKDPAIGNRMINARSETLTDKPSFRQAFQCRRCLIPADGFYEWQKTSEGKQPWYIRPEKEQLLAFAGLWETWKDTDNNLLHTCTIITRAANEFMQPLHARMPVLLDREEYSAWLNQSASRDELQELLADNTPPVLVADRVTNKVNSPVNDEPGLVKPSL